MTSQTQTTTLRRTPVFLAVLITVCLVMATMTVTASTAAPSAAQADGRDKKWAGYKIPATREAAGAWIGGRTLASEVYYRIDPTAPAGASGYGAEQLSAKVHGKGRATQRAAWVVSKYGKYRDKQQSAAVDAAVYHLLAGGAWRIFGRKGAKRVAQSGHGRAVRALAGLMVKDSARYAGPYRLSIQVNSPGVGQSAVVRAKLLSRSGRPVPKMPINISYTGVGASSGVTDGRGVLERAFPARTAGPHNLAVSATKVPATVLAVRTPSGKGTRLVTARKSVMTVRQVGAIRAVPTITVKAARKTVSKGTAITGTAVLSRMYGTAGQAGRIELFGPYLSTAAATCGGSPRASWPATSEGAGTVNLPKNTPTEGIYAWRVRLPGDRYNTPVTSCGAVTTVQLQPKITAAATSSQYGTGATPRAKITISAASARYAETGRIQLYGPFTSREAITCAPAKRTGDKPFPITSSGSLFGPNVRVNQPGFYTWRATMPEGTWTAHAVSACGADSSVFQVR